MPKGQQFDREPGLPPPMKGGRMGPEMMPEDTSIYSRLSKVANAGGAEGGMEGAGMGGEEAASQHLMNGIQELLAASQAHPQLAQLIMPLLQQLRDGMGALSSGGPMPLESRQGPPKPQRKRPPKRERGAEPTYDTEDEEM